MSSKCLNKGRQSHTGCICLTLLFCALLCKMNLVIFITDKLDFMDDSEYRNEEKMRQPTRLMKCVNGEVVGSFSMS